MARKATLFAFVVLAFVLALIQGTPVVHKTVPISFNIKTEDVTRVILKQRVKSVCYPNLGCFSVDGTFKNILSLLPATPENIDTKFRLFTRHNHEEDQEISYDDLGSLSTSFLNTSLPTYFVVHGFSADIHLQTLLSQTLLKNEDCNVVLVDWRKGSKAPEYWTAVVNSELVGRQLARLIQVLKERRSLDPLNVHIIGSSLGAHLAGFAGKWATNTLGIRIKRITGLDPGGPFFEDSSDTVHVSRRDAVFVDIIHSSAGKDVLNGELGIEKAVGHVDFYPNGGKSQPGCQKGDPDCHHMRANWLFMDSMANPGCSFKSFPCPGGYGDFQKGLCQKCGQDGCGRLGIGAMEAGGRGTQYLDTNKQSPFCKL